MEKLIAAMHVLEFHVDEKDHVSFAENQFLVDYTKKRAAEDAQINIEKVLNIG
jgi:hypothetical protein